MQLTPHRKGKAQWNRREDIHKCPSNRRRGPRRLLLLPRPHRVDRVRPPPPSFPAQALNCSHLLHSACRQLFPPEPVLASDHCPVPPWSIFPATSNACGCRTRENVKPASSRHKAAYPSLAADMQSASQTDSWTRTGSARVFATTTSSGLDTSDAPPGP